MALTAGEKIKIVMKRRGMTLGDLAEKTNQSRQNLSNKMTRDNFSEKEIKEIAKLLPKDVRWFFAHFLNGRCLCAAAEKVLDNRGMVADPGQDLAYHDHKHKAAGHSLGQDAQIGGSHHDDCNQQENRE